MKKVDMTNVKEAGDFSRPAAGAYICAITKVEDFPEKEYLRVQYDIIDGEYRGYYSDLRKQYPDSPWLGAYVKSYKPKALPMFKRFCSAVSKSNGGFVFDGNAVNADEKTLVRKKIGLVLGEEEYYGNDGELKTRLYVAREFPTIDLPAQKVPALKKIKEDSPAAPTTAAAPADPALDGFLNIPDGMDEELPFA